MKKKTKSYVGLAIGVVGLIIALVGMGITVANMLSAMMEGVSAQLIGGIIMFAGGGIASGVGFVVFLKFNYKDIMIASATDVNTALLLKKGEEKQETEKEENKKS